MAAGAAPTSAGASWREPLLQAGLAAATPPARSGLWPQYNHGAGDSNGCSIIGGFVYRGTAHPELAGRYFFGDYCSGKIWDVTAAGPASQAIQLLLDTKLKITGWGQGADGELYVVATDGGLYQLG